MKLPVGLDYLFCVAGVGSLARDPRAADWSDQYVVQFMFEGSVEVVRFGTAAVALDHLALAAWYNQPLRGPRSFVAGYLVTCPVCAL